MADFQALIRAGRVIEGEELRDTHSVENSGAACSLFIVPNDTYSAGDILYVDGNLPFTAYTRMPVVVGDWSPILWQSVSDILDSNGNSLILREDITVFYAPARVD